MTLEYRNEKFSEKWMLRFAQDLFTTAEGLLTAEKISEVSLLTEEDREQLKAFNDTAVPMDFVPVHEQIHRHAQKDPDKTAVIAAGKKLSFREMDLLSNQLAQVLVSKGAGKDQMIGVLFDREVWAYVAENAILHGICKRRRSEGLLRITSSKIVNGFRVTVEDNGVAVASQILAVLEKAGIQA